MAEPEDDFIGRWSRRKREAREEEAALPQARGPGPEGQPAPPAPADAGTAPVREEDLPDPDTLTEESDFAVFMKEGVPDVLRRRALRRLWRLNPLFANLDGLNDYDEDYTDAATVVAGLKTLYKVGQGIGDPDDDKSAAVEPEAAPVDETPPPADAPEASARAVEGVDADPDEAARDLPGPVEDAPTPAAEANRPESDSAAKSTRTGGVRGRGARARRWGES